MTGAVGRGVVGCGGVGSVQAVAPAIRLIRRSDRKARYITHGSIFTGRDVTIWLCDLDGSRGACYPQRRARSERKTGQEEIPVFLVSRNVSAQSYFFPAPFFAAACFFCLLTFFGLLSPIHGSLL